MTNLSVVESPPEEDINPGVVRGLVDALNKISRTQPIEGVKLFNGQMSAEDFKVVQSALGYTCVELADELGMSERGVQDMRAGVRRVMPHTVMLLRYLVRDKGMFF